MTPALDLTALARMSSERIAYCLVEGTLVAAFAALLLRVVRRQNAGTRFAVWFSSLVAIAALPLLGAAGWPSMREIQPVTSPSHFAITLPGSWALYLFCGWAGIASLALMRVGAGLWQIHALRKSCVPIDAQGLDPVVRATLARCQGNRAIEFCVSDRVQAPTAVGLAKPAVVVPRWLMQELSTQELEQILLHEAAHLRRWDDWTNLAQKILKALLFFHPAVWWIESKVSLEREMACDDAVLVQTSSPRAYAECLARLAEKNFIRRSLALAQAAVGQLGQTSLRVAQILDVNRPRATKVWKPAVSFVAVFAIACAASCFGRRSSSPSRTAAPRTLANVAAVPQPEVARAQMPVNPFVHSPFLHSAATRRQVGIGRPPAPRLRTLAANEKTRNGAAPNHAAILAFLATDGTRGQVVPAIVPVKDSGTSPVAVSETVVVFVVGGQRGSPDYVTYQMCVWHITVLSTASNPAVKAAPQRVI